MLTNISAERSFSQLKRDSKTHTEQRCVWRDWTLSLLCIEADVLSSVDFDDEIKDFVFAKSRKTTS
jgi:hypothetical protein